MRSHLRNFLVFVLALVAGLAFSTLALAETGPLPSWNDTDTKKAILTFVEKTTGDSSSADYVAPANRIVTFDNDGTLWVEHPMCTQLAFALDRVKELAPQHPEWKPDSHSRRCSTMTLRHWGPRAKKAFWNWSWHPMQA